MIDGVRGLWLLLLCVVTLQSTAVIADALPGRAMWLIAAPKLTDPTFAKSIVLVTRHGRSPPIGVIVNRPTPMDLSEVFPSLNTRSADKLFFGGPVDRDRIVYLFQGEASDSPNGAIELAPALFLSREPALLGELLRGQRPHRGLRVFGGFAGWAPGQLEQEIRRGDWHLLEVQDVRLFDHPPEALWQDLSERARSRAARHLNPVGHRTSPTPFSHAPGPPPL